MVTVRVDLAQNLLLSGHAAHALQILDEALYLARQVSEIRDVLTARTIASMQETKAVAAYAALTIIRHLLY